MEKDEEGEALKSFSIVIKIEGGSKQVSDLKGILASPKTANI
jgi:hypothetical protein